MLFSSIILTHRGHHYRFAEREQQLECQVCYWKGIILLPHDHNGLYRAYIEQKYAPYRQIWAQDVLRTQDEALRWVAATLRHEEEAQGTRE